MKWTITGWALVGVGFLWLAFGAIMKPAEQVAVLWHHAHDIQTQTSFTQDEMGKIVYDTGNDVVDHRPWILLPAVMMLAGCLIIGRRRKDQGVPRRS